MKLTDIVVRPVISEKSMQDAGKGKFTFVVAQFATKTMIKHAVSEMFTVNVTHVITRIQKGKTKRTGTRRMEKTLSSWKKAVVTLKSGEKISLFEL